MTCLFVGAYNSRLQLSSWVSSDVMYNGKFRHKMRFLLQVAHSLKSLL
jgi:hypothetical protein